MSDTNTHKCIGTVKNKIPQATKGGSKFVLLILTLGEDNEICIECWKEVRDALDFIAIGSKVEAHSWVSGRSYKDKNGNPRWAHDFKARSVSDLGKPVQVFSDQPEEQGENIDF